MNPLMLVAIICLILGTAFGALLSTAVRYVKRLGKLLLVTVNPNTHELDFLYRRATDEEHVKLLGGDVPLEGDRRYHHKNRPAFIVDTVTGHPLKVLNGTFVELPGSRLREIRKGIKQKIIAAANSANIEAYLKYGLIGLCILGAMLLGIFFILARGMGSGGAA